MSSKRRSPDILDLDAEIEVKHRQLKELTRRRDEDAVAEVDAALNAWRKKLALCKYNKKARFQLRILGFEDNKQQYIGMAWVSFCDANETPAWRLKHYMQYAYCDATPLCYSSNFYAEHLMPDDADLLAKHKVRYEITDAQIDALADREAELRMEIIISAGQIPRLLSSTASKISPEKRIKQLERVLESIKAASLLSDSILMRG